MLDAYQRSREAQSVRKSAQIELITSLWVKLHQKKCLVERRERKFKRILRGAKVVKYAAVEKTLK